MATFNEMWLRLTKSVVKVNKTCSRRNVVKVNNRRDGNEDWGGLWGRKLLDVAIEACDYTKGKPRHSWWCNRDVGASAWRQKDLFRIWRHSQKEEDKKNTVIQRYQENYFELHQRIWIWQFERQWKMWIPAIMAMSFLELPNKEQGKSVTFWG